jgi:hypothetical protein
LICVANSFHDQFYQNQRTSMPVFDEACIQGNY